MMAITTNSSTKVNARRCLLPDWPAAGSSTEVRGFVRHMFRFPNQCNTNNISSRQNPVENMPVHVGQASLGPVVIKNEPLMI